jgi:hypothetical protein
MGVRVRERWYEGLRKKRKETLKVIGKKNTCFFIFFFHISKLLFPPLLLLVSKARTQSGRLV